MKKRVLAVLLAAGMVLSMFGCGDTTTSTDDTQKTQDSEKDSVAVEDTTSDDVANEDDQYPLLPWTGDEVTFTMFHMEPAPDTDDRTSELMKYYYEQIGNVKFEVNVVPSDDYYTKLPLMMTDGNLPDLFPMDANVNTYIGNYGANGIWLDFNDYLDHLPNVSQLFDKYAAYDYLLDGEGHRYALPAGYRTLDNVTMNNWSANLTWFEDHGYEVQKTPIKIDDFIKACKEFTDETGYAAIQQHWGMGMFYYALGLAYEHNAEYQMMYYTDRNEWGFGPTQENTELYDFLRVVNQLWEDGSIDHEINTVADETVTQNIEDGNFLAHYFYGVGDNGQPGDGVYDDFTYGAMLTPEATKSTLYVEAEDSRPTWCMSVGANCENPELLCEIIDWMFSEEGILWKNYGVEGYSYNYDEEGNIKFTDEYYNNEEFRNDINNQRQNAPIAKVMGVTDTLAGRTQDTDFYKEQTKILEDALLNGTCNARYDYAAPGLTSELAQEYADIMTPINTFLKEERYKFMYGDRDLETEFDKFVEEVKGMGDIDRAVEIYNSVPMLEFGGTFRDAEP